MNEGGVIRIGNEVKDEEMGVVMALVGEVD